MGVALLAGPTEYMHQSRDQNVSDLVQRAAFLSGIVNAEVPRENVRAAIEITLKTQRLNTDSQNKVKYLLDNIDDHEVKALFLQNDSEFSDTVLELSKEVLASTRFQPDDLKCGATYGLNLDRFYRTTGLVENPDSHESEYQNIEWEKVNFDYVSKMAEMRGELLKDISTCLTEIRLREEDSASFWRYITIVLLSISGILALTGKVIDIRAKAET